MSSTDRWLDRGAFLLFVVLAAWLLRDGLSSDRVLVSRESLQNSLPWSAVLEPHEPYNRFLGDQPRIYYPYLLEAARVYGGEASALWTTRGGGGLPFLGNITSSLLHPFTLLAALPLAVTLVPLLQGLAVLVLSAHFTWLFLRRRGLSPAACAFGAVAFGYGGHQVLWLQYALSHTLVALPFIFWATERLVSDRSRRRAAVLAAGFALLVLGGHPETALVAGVVGGLWALWRLWDSHGRFLVAGVALLAVLLSAVQWIPFLEYATLSHGLRLRQLEAASLKEGVSFGAGVVWLVVALGGMALLRNAANRGLAKRVAAIVGCTAALVMARRMGMAVAGAVVVMPELYGSPLEGGTFTGAEDFPGLNAGYAGVLAPLLTLAGVFTGVGGGFLRFYALVGAALWAAAHHVPGVEAVVRSLPGFSELGPTRMLGPAGFLLACGGATVVDELTRAAPGLNRTLSGAGRVALAALVAVGLAVAIVKAPVDPFGGRTVKAGLRSPHDRTVHDGRSPVRICLDVASPAEDLRILVDGQLIWHGPVEGTTPEEPFSMVFLAQRAEEGNHHLRVEAERPTGVEIIADQPLIIRRARQLTARDLLALGLGLAAFGWLVQDRRRHGALVMAVLVGVDVLSFANGYNVATDVDELYPPTESVAFLEAQPAPFRIFTEGTILPPDTQFAVGLDHLLSYDNLGFRRTYQWLINVPLEMDNFATFSFARGNVQYDSPRFDTLDVRFVLTDTEETSDLSDVPGMRLVHESEVRIWENTDNLGRAFLVPGVMDTSRSSYDELVAADPREVAFVEAPLEVPLGGRGTARVVAHRGDEVEIETEADGPALLVLAENRAPGWEARIDDGPWQETIPADVAWQAIPVPGGQHSVMFRYAPSSYRWGMSLSLLGAVVWLLMLVLPRHLS